MLYAVLYLVVFIGLFCGMLGLAGLVADYFNHSNDKEVPRG